MSPGDSVLQSLAGIDPTPLFVFSLFPYLLFLSLAGRVEAFPKLALRGFQLTLLFVAVTIVAAIAALQLTGRQLADVDPLHGAAEAFLTFSNLLIVLGFTGALLDTESSSRHPEAEPPRAGDDGQTGKP
jgi:Protein of unknown function (DUF3593)